MSFIVSLNRFFRPPNVEGRESTRAYSEWEYRWGRELIAKYLEPAGDLAGKTLLDIGCGLGGKTVAYGESGTAAIFGTDISLGHIEASRQFVAERPDRARYGFFASDAAHLPVADGSVDTVVANDAMEHFAEPEAAVAEMVRVTRPGGAMWFFFTPHFSPLGSHLYDYIYIPWCHLLFRRGALEGAVRTVLRRRTPQQDVAEIDREVERIMTSYDNDLNHMSVHRFLRIIGSQSQLQTTLLELRPAKYPWLKMLTRIPGVRELFTGTVVARVRRK